MNSIQISVDAALPERAGRINRKTWEAIKQKKGNSAFFPQGDEILIGNDPFDPYYLLLVVDEDLPDNTIMVSFDVKQNLYSNRTTLDY